MTPGELTEYLHRHIPLTQAIGARVVSCEAGRVSIAAPLAPNLNHRNTAFGGSLATLGILSGWTVLHCALREQNLDARLVVQKHECDFLEPAADELIAQSQLPQEEWTRFLSMLQRRQRARISIESEIRAGGTLAVKSTGTFVGLL